MVGLLNAPRLSRLYKRLDDEGRISSQFSGDNTNCATNIIPVMNKNREWPDNVPDFRMSEQNILNPESPENVKKSL